MEQSTLPAANSTPIPSGFFVLIHNPTTQWIVRFWCWANKFVRKFLPCIHFFMLLVTVAILGAIVFANQHLPCWLDEIYMSSPAYHRATEGVWHSVCCWNSIGTIPYAPNYPLFCNILRILIAYFGLNFWILRGGQLVFGLAPIVALLWLFRRKRIIRSRLEIVEAIYFAACFTFFIWSVWIRPEAIFLSVITLLIFAWASNRPILLFFSGILVPLCGLQWNVLLLPAIIYWLVFGGRFRNTVLLILALLISSMATLVVYHRLGMWPSYLQEAARIGGLDIFHHVLSRMIAGGLKMDFTWFFSAWGENPAPAWSLVLVGACALPSFLGRWHKGSSKRLSIFLLLAETAVWLSMALAANLNFIYLPLAPLPLAFCVSTWSSPLRDRQPAAFFLVTNIALGIAGTNAKHLCKWFPNHAPSIAEAKWLDERALENALSGCWPSGAIVLADDSAYCAISTCKGYFLPACYAFDLSSSERVRVGAILLEDAPYPLRAWNANWRCASYSRVLQNGQSWAFVEGITADQLIDVIGNNWNCTFTEIPIAQSTWHRAIHYRLFLPVFSEPDDKLPNTNITLVNQSQ